MVVVCSSCEFVTRQCNTIVDCLEGISECLIAWKEEIIKHLLVFLALNIIVIGQLEKDIRLRLLVTKYLPPADQ